MGKGRDVQRHFPKTWLSWFLERESFTNLYAESMKNIEQATNFCIDNHSRIGIEEYKIPALEKLRKILFEEKWIYPEDMSHIEEAKQSTPLEAETRKEAV